MRMSVNDYVLVRGMRDTRTTLESWQRDPWPLLRRVFAGALGVTVVLLGGVWVIASASTPEPEPIYIVGVDFPASLADIAQIFFRNCLVLAFHATACVAGFIAGSSIPISAERRSGFSRRLHEHAGRIAIGFVIAVTLFSLCNQAYFLGRVGSTMAHKTGLTPAELTLTLLPHAVPELVAIFLPLAAWIMLSRRGEWRQLLAATFITVAVAIPMLVVSALIEVYIWPEILLQAAPGIA
jgi:hypothetical protein